MIDVKDLDGMSNSELIRIFHIFNYWRWPDVLGEKPDGWDDMPNYKKPFMEECQTKEDIMRPYVKVIYSRIRRTELLP